MINTKKLKQNLMKEKSIQIFIMIKPKEGFHSTCLSLILIDSAFKMSKTYYPEVLLEECKYIVKEKEVTRHIIEDRDILSDDSDKSDEE